MLENNVRQNFSNTPHAICIQFRILLLSDETEYCSQLERYHAFYQCQYTHSFPVSRSRSLAATNKRICIFLDGYMQDKNLVELSIVSRLIIKFTLKKGETIAREKKEKEKKERKNKSTATILHVIISLNVKL